MEKMKFYSKINVDFIDPDEENYDENYWCDPMDDKTITCYQEHIDTILKVETNRGNDWNGDFMKYFWSADDTTKTNVKEKVKSAFLSTEEFNNKLYAVMTCECESDLTEKEINVLKEYFTGQYSDGFGEGLEQREHECDDTKIFIKLWNPDDFKIQTEAEFFGQQNKLDLNI